MNFQSGRFPRPMAAPPQTLKNSHKFITTPNPAFLDFLESVQHKESRHKISDLMDMN